MRPRRILVVEDDADVLRAMCVRLRAAGYEVATAADTAGAVQAARNQSPDLILLDLGLPAGGGHRVLERLGQLGLSERVPVVVVSAWDAATHEARSLEEGAVAYLQKPVEPDRLLGTVARHLSPLTQSSTAETRPRVLLIEDDADMRLALRIRLEASGFETSFAADAPTALTQAVKVSPQLILLDLGLPGGDGFTLLGRLRQHVQLAFVPVVVLSARDPVQFRQRALEAGACAYLQKPVEPQELVTALRHALGRVAPNA